MRWTIFTTFLFLFTFTAPLPAAATHFRCVEADTVLNATLAAHPGSLSIARYEGLDALTYLSFVNGLTHGNPYVVGETVIVMGNSNYNVVLAIVFHGGCHAGSVALPEKYHYQWNEMITGAPS